ncbi:hypothetical protein ACFPRL_07915 [Pseudoclavibacter helvolus]
MSFSEGDARERDDVSDVPLRREEVVDELRLQVEDRDAADRRDVARAREAVSGRRQGGGHGGLSRWLGRRSLRLARASRLGWRLRGHACARRPSCVGGLRRLRRTARALRGCPTRAARWNLVF